MVTVAIRAAVLGAGDMGMACALSLAANGCPSVSLLSRDPLPDARCHATSPSASGVCAISTVAPKRPGFGPVDLSSSWAKVQPELSLPPEIRAGGMRGGAGHTHDCVFVCLPPNALTDGDDGVHTTQTGARDKPATTSLFSATMRAPSTHVDQGQPTRHMPLAVNYLRHWAENHSASGKSNDNNGNNCSTDTNDGSRSHDDDDASDCCNKAVVTDRSLGRYVTVFTRGMSADGELPSTMVQRYVGSGTPVIVASGPLFAREWGAQSSPRPRSLDTVSDNDTKTCLAMHGEANSCSAASSSCNTSSSFTSPSCPSAHNDTAETSIATSLRGGKLSCGGRSHVDETNPLSSKMAKCDQRVYPHAFSGTSLLFALATPALQSNSAAQHTLAAHLGSRFGREGVTWLGEPHDAEVMGIVNACLPLCAFGAGLVSNVYTQSPVSALASYAQHACHATQALVAALVPERALHTPLPIGLQSTLFMTCTNLLSRECVLGRRLDFYFRKQDALRAVYPEGMHAAFTETVDGLHTRLSQNAVSSPFYETLMDGFHTFLRASVVGEGLVKQGYYDYRDAHQHHHYSSNTRRGPSASSSLIRKIMDVDEAMLSGDEDLFVRAKADLARSLSSSSSM